MTKEDWDLMRHEVYFDWNKDTHFMELQEAEMMRNRVELLRDMEEFKGSYFSAEWLRKKILNHSEEEIQEIDKQMAKESEESESTEEEIPPEDELT